MIHDIFLQIYRIVVLILAGTLMLTGFLAFMWGCQKMAELFRPPPSSCRYRKHD